jgi:hypothetical protein
MNKIQELAAKRIEDVRAKWRTDTGDAAMVEMYLTQGASPTGTQTTLLASWRASLISTVD